MVKKISNFYIPIDYSNLQKIIPENDEILYSTLCEAKGKTKWNTHLLVSKLGIAYEDLQENENKESKFVKWIEIHDDGSVQFKKNKIYFNSTLFTVIQDETYEEKTSFKSRSKNFGSFCKILFDSHKRDYNKYFIEKISNMYVPIDYSELSKRISKTDKIVYSTLSEVLLYEQLSGNKSREVKYKSHVLLTESSLVFIDPLDEMFGSQYFPWNTWTELTSTKNKLHVGHPFHNKGTVRFSLIRDENFESPETFKTRNQDFLPLCQTLWEEQNHFVAEMKKYKENFNENFTNDGYDGFMIKADRFYHSVFHDETLELYNEALKILPEEKTKEIWEKKGIILLVMKRKEEAIECFDNVLKLDPNNEYAQNSRDRLNLEIKLDSVSNNDKNKASKLVNKGISESKKKKLPEAIDFFENALKLNPYDVQTWMRLGKTYEAQEKYEEAKKCFQEILKLNPKNNTAAESLRRIHDSI